MSGIQKSTVWNVGNIFDLISVLIKTNTLAVPVSNARKFKNVGSYGLQSQIITFLPITES